MATSNNAESVNNVANKAWNVLKWTGRALEKIGKGIVIIIALLAITFIFFNPLFFVPYSLLAPRKAAESLYDWDLPVYMDLMQCLYAPFVAVLPFRWKKHFMAVHGVYNYSDKLQCRYYNTMVLASAAERVELIKKQMSSSAVDLLWAQNLKNWCVREEIIKAGVTLSDQQFALLVNNAETVQVKEYLEQKTPSESMMRKLLSTYLGDLFLFCVERYGLSTRLINEVFEMEKITPVKNNEYQKMFHKTIASLTKDALIRFSQRQMVRNIAVDGNSREWGMFLSDSGEICLAAQKMMTAWQYDVYHNAGFHLSAEAIVHFFSKGETNMCERIFRYEPKEALNDKALTIMAANPKLVSLALHVAEK